MVTFRCPVTEKLYHAIATMRATGASQQRTRTEMFTDARRGFRGLLRGVFASAVAGETAVPARNAPAPTAVFDRAARETAVVEAFEALASQFAWDESRKAYIDAEEARNSLGGFDRQLRDHPLKGKYELVTCGRMLAEIVAADGRVKVQERDFFNSFLSAETGTLEELVKLGRITRLEMEETRPAARATMLMLAYAIAMTDEHLDLREQNTLAKFAKGLGVGLDREETIRHWACEKVVENMLAGCYGDGRLDDAELKRIARLAQNIGVNEALVAKLDVRVRKRMG